MRAYTNKTLRHTKDIDLAVSKKKDIQELKGILRKIGYSVSERPHGLSGYRKERGEAIVVNAIVEDVKSLILLFKPFNRILVLTWLLAQRERLSPLSNFLENALRDWVLVS